MIFILIIKKLAGILFQNFIKGDRIEYSIAGIGINVNQKKLLFLTLQIPISLIHYTQKQINLVKLLTKLLDKIGNNYDKFIFENNHSQLKSVYIDNLYRFGEWAIFSDLNSKFNGKIIDIDNYGRLIVELISGEKESICLRRLSLQMISNNCESLT